MIRILIADDHPIVRQGIRHILDETADLRAVAESVDASTTLAALAHTECDIVLLDLTMPGADGLDLIKLVHDARPTLPILVLTLHPEDEFAVRALKLGASGYLTKEAAPSELVGAIRKVVAGGYFVSDRLAERLAAELQRGRIRAPHEKLSDREYQIFRMIAAGKRTREISADLSLSVKTVSTYRARIFEKMELHTSGQLVAYALRNRLNV
jgi:DNA-binding NarL/FixJ family response regulator